MSEFERITILEQKVKKLSTDLSKLIDVVEKLSSKETSKSATSTKVEKSRKSNLKIKTIERTLKYVSGLKPLILVDRKRFISISDAFHNLDSNKRKRSSKDKEEKDDSNENKKAKKEKSSNNNVAEVSTAPAPVPVPSSLPPTIKTAQLMEKLQTITLYDNKIDAIKDLTDEQLKKLCNNKAGTGMELIVEWLNEEATYMENNPENFRGIALVKSLVRIIDPTAEKLIIKWNADKIKTSRIDKVVRRIYKSLQAKIGPATTGTNPELDILIQMTDVLKKNWSKFRELFHEGKDK